MKRATIALGALLAVTACGSTGTHPSAAASVSAPRVSASAACHDFALWFLSTNLPDHPTTFKAGNLALLNRAVSESPSGTLYQDMSTLKSDVLDKLVPWDTRVGAVTVGSYQVETDCQAINPGQS